MNRSRVRHGFLVILVAMAGCTGVTPEASSKPDPTAATPTVEPSPAATASPTMAQPTERRTLLVDTDVAGDDLVALAFLLSAPQVSVAAITVSGTGEAHCPGGVEVVLRLLDLLDAPDIPVACGRETPLAGSHTFPDAWRERVDQGSRLDLPATDRTGSGSTAVELIQRLTGDHPDLVILTLGPVTNLAEALLSDPGLAERLGPVFVMGGALHVPGNLVCCGAPEDNSVAEWNIYVDPHAAQVVVDSGVEPAFVSLDGTNHVPVTPEFARQAMEHSDSAAAMVLADLFAANPFMTDGSYFLWDPLAAMLAAGYPVGSFSPECIVVEEAEGPESGFTRPGCEEPNIRYLASADAAAAEAALLGVLIGG